MVNGKRLQMFLLASTLAGGALAAATPALAEEPSYQMSAYWDRPGGPEVLAGDYAAAIAAASARAASTDSIANLVAATNLCVAYTMKASLDAASTACDRAVQLATAVDTVGIRGVRVMAATSRALSNRGVLRALKGDWTGAVQDFRRAADLSGHWSAPGRNLARLETTPAYRLARAEASAD